MMRLMRVRFPSWRAVVLLTGLLAAGNGMWIPVKAQLAQWLLERSWRCRGVGGGPTPWPWADFKPVARLRIPLLDRELLVLNDASGRSLAFGPGWVAGSAPPGETGHTVISGHRDTHFAFLDQLRPGDPLELEGVDGRVGTYRVVTAEVLDVRSSRLQIPAEGESLSLLTCYPLDAVVPGGPLRYLVTAERTT